MVLQWDDRRGESGREAERQPPGRGRLPPACSPSPQGEQRCEGQEVGSRAGGLRPDPRPRRPQPARPEEDRSTAVRPQPEDAQCLVGGAGNNQK